MFATPIVFLMIVSISLFPISGKDLNCARKVSTIICIHEPYDESKYTLAFYKCVHSPTSGCLDTCGAFKVINMFSEISFSSFVENSSTYTAVTFKYCGFSLKTKFIK